MKKLEIGAIVSQAWDLAVKHWPIFVLFSFVTSLISGLGVSVDPERYAELITNSSDPAAQVAMLAEVIQVNYILVTIGFLLSIYLSYVVYNLYVTAYCKGKPYESMASIFKVDLNRLAIYFCVGFVYGIVVGLGTCLCILPGIWIAIRLWYAPVLAATQDVTFGEAFSRSWQMTKGHFWELLLMGITMIGIAIVGFAACCVGIFFADVITNFMLIISMFLLMPQAPEPESVIGDEATASSDYVEVQ